MVGEEERSERTFHVEPYVEREHAQEDVGTHTVLAVVADGFDGARARGLHFGVLGAPALEEGRGLRGVHVVGVELKPDVVLHG